ncbi:MAG: AAA family ATPase [Maricaulis sp.]|uniref:AAA family ATPase n=1 Tax=Maricaulis sp. TaxID=1486257 RepID=UPI00260499C7|nr:AAA family ATPase [Maricaulis sp.]MDM7983256.1 AAA family ATPase [Maricaulis sp.]
MLISVFPPHAISSKRFDTPFALHQDNWNDYGFRTQYHLYANDGSNAPEQIGTVKILRRGQTKTDPILITKAFEALGDEFVSVGESLDYYQRLNSLPPDLRDRVLRALRDAVFHPNLVAEFQDESGWNTSIFRGHDERGQSREEQKAFLGEAAAVFSGNFTEFPSLSEPLQFTPRGWGASLNVTFDAPDTDSYFVSGLGGKRMKEDLPHGCAVLIGPNGAGKSTILSRLARVAFASPGERSKDDVQKIGELSPPGIGFFKIITISYSAFDSFALPGVYAADLEQIAKDVDRGEGRFVYCGLRDIVGEVREDLQALDAEGNPVPDNERRRLPARDRRDSIRLKTLNDLADEFVRHLVRIYEKDRGELFERCMAPLLADRSFAGLPDRTAAALLGDDPKAAFLSWSTGHKIALHVIAAVVAHAQARSIVLFDEPETHLHPPMIAALMHGYRRALEETGALSILATHSPVVLQETLAKHVRVIRRVGDKTTIAQPDSETFGENIGTLVYDTFGLTASDTDFHNVLDHLIATKTTVDEIDAYFEPTLSAQARAYVIAGLAAKTRGEG